MTVQPVYDRLGVNYARRRRADPAIARLIRESLGDARTVVSIGAGTGSYEPADLRVVAVEPSSVMVHQRPLGAAPVIRGVAEHLPVSSGSFDAALAVLTLHHWSDPLAGLGEMRRVARRHLVLTFDPDAHCTHWLADYVPELTSLFRATPDIELVADALDAVSIVPVPLRHDTPDGMTVAYWRRPEAYLDPEVRAGGSAFHQVDPAALARGLEALKADLDSGEWRLRYGDLLGRDSMDYGLRLIMS